MIRDGISLETSGDAWASVKIVLRMSSERDAMVMRVDISVRKASYFALTVSFIRAAETWCLLQPIRSLRGPRSV